MVSALVGAFLLIAAVAFHFQYKKIAKDLQEMRATDTSTVAQIQDTYAEIVDELGSSRDFRERVELKGTIRCDSPLKAEMSQRNCVYYEIRIERERESLETVTDASGNSSRRVTRKKETIQNSKQSAAFFLVDETGEISVFPEKARIDTVESFKSYEDANDPGNGSSRMQFGNFRVDIKTATNRPDSRVLGYHARERLLPVDIPCYVLGEVTNETGKLAVRAPADANGAFIISYKTEAQLIGGKSAAAKNTNIASIALGILGLLGVAFGLMSPFLPSEVIPH